MKENPRISAFIMRLRDHARYVIHPSLAREARALKEKRAGFYRQFIRDGDLVFDVGANLGNRVEPLLAINARVVAFEPQEMCAQYLRLRFGKRLVVESVAVGSEAGTGVLMLNEDSTTVASMSKEWRQKVGLRRFSKLKWGNSRKVAIVTLADAIRKYGKPAFVKIDVEGYEAEVLKGLDTACTVISFEYTTPEMTAEALTCLDIIHRLSGSYRFNFAHGESCNLELERWITHQHMIELLSNEPTRLRGFGDIYARLEQ